MKYKSLTTILFSAFLLIAPNVKAANFNDNQAVDINKTWTIKFNGEVGLDDVTKQGITVTDSEGKQVKVVIKLGENNKTVTVTAPEGGYTAGESYVLNIGTKAHSNKGKALKSEYKMHFSIKSDISTSDNLKLKSLGHFVDERNYKLFLNGQSDGLDLSGIDVRLSNLNGNSATIEFVYSSTGGSTPLNGHGPATYMGNGEWKFKFINEAYIRYGIGIFKVVGDKGYINTKQESYAIPEGKELSEVRGDFYRYVNEMTVTDKDYEEISKGEFNTVYRINN